MDNCLKIISKQFNISEAEIRTIISKDVIFRIMLNINDVIDKNQETSRSIRVKHPG